MTVLLAFTIFLLAIASGIAGIMFMGKSGAEGGMLMTAKMFAEAKREQERDVEVMARMEKSIREATVTIEQFTKQLDEVCVQVERITGQPQASLDHAIETLRAMRKRPALAPKPEGHARVTLEISRESLDALMPDGNVAAESDPVLLSMSEGIPRAGGPVEPVLMLQARPGMFVADLAEGDRARMALVPEGIEGVVEAEPVSKREAFTAALTEEFKTYQPEPVQ